MRTTKLLLAAAIAAAVLAVAAGAAAKPLLGQFKKVATLASTVPASGPAMGDQNPYGVAVVPRTTGELVAGDVLVSNFNNSHNQQGTGSSIVEVSPAGRAKVFAIVPAPTRTPAVGLTTALVALRNGYVVVGSLPAPGGKSSAAGAGALTVLDANGKVVKVLKGGDINGPWDMTAAYRGADVLLFVTNVLNGTVAAEGKVVRRGTVVRVALEFHRHHVSVLSNRVIGTGFAEHTDPNALIVGPTGVGLGGNGVLYVADSDGNRVAAIANAATRTTVAQHGGSTVSSGGALNDPLGLAIAPGGDVLTANGGDGKLVETTPRGRRTLVKTLIRDGAGDLFGLAVAPRGAGVYFVDDAGTGAAANSLRLLH
jgi:hypothetical protein